MSKLSRREFLKVSTLGIGSALLTACGIKPQSLYLSKPTVLPVASPVIIKSSPTAVAIETVSTAKVVSATPAGRVIPFSGTQILGRPTQNAVTLSILPARDGQILIEYGTTPGSYAMQTTPIPASAGVPATVLLENLRPNTSYTYRMRDADQIGPEHHFVTQRTPGSAFTFTIDADPHNRDPNFDGQLYGITLANALKDRPDFHINLGDTFMTEKLNATTLQAVVNSYLDMRPYFGTIGADAPLFLVNGNHEGELGWFVKGNDQNLAVWCTQTRQKYYPNPTPNAFYSGSTTQESITGIRDSYYAWTWGDALFVVLDPYWYTTTKPGGTTDGWAWTLGETQYRWLKQTLEQSNATYKFVFAHQLVGGDSQGRGGTEFASLYEWGGKNVDGSQGFEQHRPGWGVPIHQLLVANNVTAFFHGHDHFFAKQELDGIIYQEVPQPATTSPSNRSPGAEYGYTIGVLLGSPGHLRITVSPGSALVEYIGSGLPANTKSGAANGEVVYSYTLSPGGTA